MILVSVPYFDDPYRIRRAVDLLLAQTVTDIRVVVTRDGCRISPWPMLDDIRDQRLVRFELAKNRGRYFVDSVALAANPYELFSVHDSDDWSQTTRLATLVDELNEADAVSDGWYRHGVNDQVEKFTPKPEMTGMRAGRSLWHFAHHKGLWRTDKLRLLGMGADFRVGWDTYLMHFASKFLKVEWSKHVGYHQQRRRGSLTQSSATGVASRFRAATIVELDKLWAASLDSENVAGILQLSRETETAVIAEAERLLELL